jgi:subtilisin family serine protease
VKLLWIVVSLPVLSAQVVPNRYIVELRRTPNLGGRSRVRPEVERSGARVLGATETVLPALIVQVPDREAGRLAGIAGVARVHRVRLVRPNLDHALPLHHIPEAWAAIGGPGKAGAGIKIAIIDSGIAQEHPAFQDPALPMPPGFPRANQERDLAYTTNKVIVARNYVNPGTPRDGFGHGTAVAMEAAGAANDGPLGAISGVAPKAWLGSYKVYQDETPFGEDTVLQAIEDAVNDGMDIINLSLGVAVAGRIESDVLVAAVERAAALGVIVCAAAGNSGDAPNTVASPATAPSVLAAGATYNDRVFAPGAVRRNGEPAYYAIPAMGRVPLSSISAPLRDVTPLDGTGEACGPLPGGTLAGTIALIARSPQTGPACSFAQKLTNAQNAGAQAAVVSMSADSTELVTMDARTTTLPAVSVDYAAGLDIRKHLADSPTPVYSLQFATTAFARDPQWIASFSSRGPNVNLGIKPDLLTTGVFLYTATQKTNPNSPLYGATGYLKEADGTSFAAPLVAGAAALLKAARPGLTAAQYRSLLVNSAAPLASAHSGGAGVLHVQAALGSTVAVAPVSLGFGAGAGTADVTRELTIANLAAAEDTIVISTGETAPGVSLEAETNVLRIRAGGEQRISIRLRGSGLAAGEYQGWIRLRGTQSAVETIVPYWYGVADGVPRHVTTLGAPSIGESGAPQDVYFRVTDGAGTPLALPAASVRALSESGSVLSVTSEDKESPGVFHAILLLGNDDGPNVFEIAAGPAKQQLVIQGLSW